MAARHNPRCPLCGAPTRALSFRDGNAWSCTDCEALTVEAAAARDLLSVPAPQSGLLEPTAPLGDGPWAPAAAAAPPAPPPPARPVAPARPAPRPVEAAPAPRVPAELQEGWFEGEGRVEPARTTRARPRRRPSRSPAVMLLGLAASFALLVLAVPASVLVYRVARDRSARQHVAAPPAVALAETLGGPAPPVVLPAPEPVELPVEDDRADPDRGAPAQSSLVQEGWALVEVTPARAVELFEAALRADPTSAEARYGLGYAMLRGGDRGGGTRWLCAARDAGGVELRREVQSLLDHHQLTCSP